MLEVVGTSVLGGSLLVSLEFPDYRPNVGDLFDVLTSGTIEGAFDDLFGLELGNDLRLAVEYLGTGVRVVAVPESTTGLLLAIGLPVLAQRRSPPA